MAKSEIKTFQKTVWAFYKKHGRHTLVWRKTQDPYQVLVSEVMLQQTQVDRVIPLYTQFIKKFPTAKKLASAPLSEVLKAWQGLGYNRRAKLLREAAQYMVLHKNQPITTDLPGVGPYTAAAVAAFAYNKDGVVIETNIRTAVIHHFFPKKKKVSDKEIAKILKAVFPQGKARTWYSALMDYGASLKRSGISHNARTKSYVKQKKFAGSLREARGVILRTLVRGKAPSADLIELLGSKRRAQMREALHQLFSEQLIEREAGMYKLAD
jgi:A/G-specific adenine glycosylase